MADLKLTDDISIDPANIVSAKLIRKGATIETPIAGHLGQKPEAPTAPEDELIVELSNESKFAIRGEQEVKNAWKLISQAQKDQHLPIEMTGNEGSKDLGEM